VVIHIFFSISRISQQDSGETCVCAPKTTNNFESKGLKDQQFVCACACVCVTLCVCVGGVTAENSINNNFKIPLQVIQFVWDDTHTIFLSGSRDGDRRWDDDAAAWDYRD
jgi:hypothetical protein